MDDKLGKNLTPSRASVDSDMPAKRFRHIIIYWGIFLIAVAATAGVLYNKIGAWVATLTDAGITVKLDNNNNAQLALDPQTTTVKVGDVIAANIVLDTKGQPIDGVDIYALHYDPSLLEVVDDIPDKAGTQIKPGAILSLNAANIVDKTSGTIKYGQVAAGGTSFEGHGVLATIHFKTLAAGTAFLKFDFTPGNTIDSNAAYRGKDRLAKVVDAIYTIQAK